MKYQILFVVGLAPILAGCSSALVTGTPVGPDPSGRLKVDPDGYLLVFSRIEARSDNGNMAGDDPVYYQHTDYFIYSREGKRLKHVANTTRHYDEAPRLVRLPPGTYTVKAPAECYDWVTVPVVIKSSQTTVVHLDKNWQPTSSARNSDVVKLPGGYAVGWSASPSGPANGH